MQSNTSFFTDVNNGFSFYDSDGDNFSDSESDTSSVISTDSSAEQIDWVQIDRRLTTQPMNDPSRPLQDRLVLHQYHRNQEQLQIRATLQRLRMSGHRPTFCEFCLGKADPSLTTKCGWACSGYCQDMNLRNTKVAKWRAKEFKLQKRRNKRVPSSNDDE